MLSECDSLVVVGVVIKLSCSPRTCFQSLLFTTYSQTHTRTPDVLVWRLITSPRSLPVLLWTSVAWVDCGGVGVGGGRGGGGSGGGGGGLQLASYPVGGATIGGIMTHAEVPGERVGSPSPPPQVGVRGWGLLLCQIAYLHL